MTMSSIEPSSSAAAWDGSCSGGYSSFHEKSLLPNGFAPSANDVVIGRGRKIHHHIGNERFRNHVAQRIQEYAVTNSRIEKSYIIQTIVKKIRSSNGGFVKFDPNDNRWYEVGDEMAREKTSQTFRDFLSEKYASSNETKKRARQGQTSTRECNPQAAKKTKTKHSVDIVCGISCSMQNVNDESMALSLTSKPQGKPLPLSIPGKALAARDVQSFYQTKNPHKNSLYGASYPFAMCNMKADIMAPNLTQKDQLKSQETQQEANMTLLYGSSYRSSLSCLKGDVVVTHLSESDPQKPHEVQHNETVLQEEEEYLSPLQAALAMHNLEIPFFSSTNTITTKTNKLPLIGSYMQDLLSSMCDDNEFSRSTPHFNSCFEPVPVFADVPASAANAEASGNAAAPTPYHCYGDQVLAALEPLPIRNAAISSSYSSAMKYSLDCEEKRILKEVVFQISQHQQPKLLQQQQEVYGNHSNDN